LNRDEYGNTIDDQLTGGGNTEDFTNRSKHEASNYVPVFLTDAGETVATDQNPMKK
jgi:hypothetical protein